MSNANSTYLNNTGKDLVGAIAAVVILTALFRRQRGHLFDSDFQGFLESSSQEIGKLVETVLSAACSQDMKPEVLGTVSDLVPPQKDYYDERTVNALLSLYAGQKELKNYCAATDAEFRNACREILERKLIDLVQVVLWSRVEAYERGVPVSEFELSPVYDASLALLPVSHRAEMSPSAGWVLNATRHWRESQMTQTALKLTAGQDSGLSKVLSQL